MLRQDHPVLSQLDDEEFERITEILFDPVVHKVLDLQMMATQAAAMTLDPNSETFKHEYHTTQILFQHLNNLRILPQLLEEEAEQPTLPGV